MDAELSKTPEALTDLALARFNGFVERFYDYDYWDDLLEYGDMNDADFQWVRDNVRVKVVLDR